LWKEFMINDGPESHDIGLLRGHVSQISRTSVNWLYRHRKERPERRAGNGSSTSRVYPANMATKHIRQKIKIPKFLVRPICILLILLDL
jgi:hypothetical protein